MMPHISLVGTGGADADGNITFYEDTDTTPTTYNTIAAGDHSGNGALLLLPDNFHAYVHRVEGMVISLEDISGNIPGASINLQMTGITRYSDKSPDQYRSSGSYESLDLPIFAGNGPTVYKDPMEAILHGSDAGAILLFLKELVSAQDVDMNYEMVFFIWYDNEN